MASRLATLLLLLLSSCAGTRVGLFGGISEGEGVYDGLSVPLVQSTEGSFVGAFMSVEVTPPTPPRRAPLLSLIDRRHEVRPEPVQPLKTHTEPAEALDPLTAYGGGGALLIALLTLIKMIPTLRAATPE